MNGKYTLDVPNNATLVISFIGYTTKEIKVGSQSVLNVSLVEEAIGLNEVVAIGYGYVKKKDLTGAVSTVSADDMVLGLSLIHIYPHNQRFLRLSGTRR